VCWIGNVPPPKLYVHKVEHGHEKRSSWKSKIGLRKIVTEEGTDLTADRRPHTSQTIYATFDVNSIIGKIGKYRQM
jgi:hypothetical protein